MKVQPQGYFLPDDTPVEGTVVGSGPRGFYTRVVRHQFFLMLVIFLLTLGVAVGYLLAVKPVFTATASLVIDMRKVQPLNPQTAGQLVPVVDDPVVLTEVELIR